MTNDSLVNEITDTFDHAQGYTFSTYATWWIKQSIGRAVDDESPLDVVTERVDSGQIWHRLAGRLTTTPGLGARAVEILQTRYGCDGQDPMTLDQIGPTS